MPEQEEIPLSLDLPPIWDAQEGDDEPAIEYCWKCRKKGIKTPINTTKGLLRKFPQQTSACLECIDEYNEQKETNEKRNAWRALCPPEYQTTDVKHEAFNRTAYLEARKHPMSASLFFYGRSGSCKTRSMLQRAKIALRDGLSVNILFPEDIKEYARHRERKYSLELLTRFDYLGLDDLFAAGTGTDAVADWIKDLIDRRIRYQRATVITSQLTEEDYSRETRKWRNFTEAETKRLDAIFRRLKEKYIPILFDNENTDTGELPF